MSYDSKIAYVSGLLKESAFSEDRIKQFLADLTGTEKGQLGGINETALAACKYEDLESIGLPKLVARIVAESFRRESQSSDQTTGTTLPAGKVDKMTWQQLMERFDPSEPTDKVARRLKEISRGEPFLVFNDNGTIDIESSRKLLGEVKDGAPGRKLYKVGAESTRVYRIGEQPDRFLDENPLYPKLALRPDGTCDQTQRSWGVVPLRVRQLLYMTNKRHSKNRSQMDVHRLIDIAISDTAWEQLCNLFPDESAEFKSAEKIGDLPTLKLRVSLPLEVGSNGPFPERRNGAFDGGRVVVPAARRTRGPVTRGVGKLVGQWPQVTDLPHGAPLHPSWTMCLGDGSTFTTNDDATAHQIANNMASWSMYNSYNKTRRNHE